MSGESFAVACSSLSSLLAPGIVGPAEIRPPCGRGERAEESLSGPEANGARGEASTAAKGSLSGTEANGARGEASTAGSLREGGASGELNPEPD